jgi:hypothetical protein
MVTVVIAACVTVSGVGASVVNSSVIGSVVVGGSVVVVISSVVGIVDYSK